MSCDERTLFSDLQVVRSERRDGDAAGQASVCKGDAAMSGPNGSATRAATVVLAGFNWPPSKVHRPNAEVKARSARPVGRLGSVKQTWTRFECRLDKLAAKNEAHTVRSSRSLHSFKFMKIRHRWCGLRKIFASEHELEVRPGDLWSECMVLPPLAAIGAPQWARRRALGPW